MTVLAGNQALSIRALRQGWQTAVLGEALNQALVCLALISMSELAGKVAGLLVALCSCRTAFRVACKCLTASRFQCAKNHLGRAIRQAAQEQFDVRVSGIVGLGQGATALAQSRNEKHDNGKMLSIYFCSIPLQEQAV